MESASQMSTLIDVLVILGIQITDDPFSMVSFAEVRTRPSVQVLTKDNILGFAKSADVSVMAFWDGADVSSNATFTKVAEEYLDFYKFGATSDPDVARIFGLSAHGLALHKTYDQREMYHHGSFEVDVLADFITTNSIPLVAEYEKRWSWCYPSKVRSILDACREFRTDRCHRMESHSSLCSRRLWKNGSDWQRL